jgi:hypothetical protein
VPCVCVFSWNPLVLHSGCSVQKPKPHFWAGRSVRTMSHQYNGSESCESIATILCFVPVLNLDRTHTIDS